MFSAFARRNTEGDLSSDILPELSDEFENDWDFFLVIEFIDELLPITKTQIKKHQLKAADSIPLSSALWLKSAIKENVTFATSDNALLRAAKIEGLEIVTPEGGSPPA